MGTFNLTEAAKEILAGNVSAKQRGQESGVGDTKLSTNVAYGNRDAGVVGSAPEKEGDELPDYLKGTPTATPPGATPPVGAEKDGVGATSPKNQPQETQGRSDLRHPTTQSAATDYSAIRDRIAGKLAPQTFQKNAGATFQQYEEVDPEDEDLEDLDEASKIAEKKAKKKQKKMMKKMKEDVDAMLSGENLSEEFKEKATTIFEAAVIARAEEIIAESEAELMEQFASAVEEVKEEIASKVDDYLNYMVQEWVEENQLAIESGLRAEIMEDLMSSLRNVFIEHHIDIPEDKVNVVEELAAKVEELEAALNEQILDSVELSKELSEHKKFEAIYTACDGLTQTQVEKLKSLAEGVEFTTEDEFVSKLEVIKESYFSNPVKTASNSVLDDEVLIEEAPKKFISDDPSMDLYAKTISQTLKK